MTRDWSRSEDAGTGSSVGAPEGVPGKSTRSGKIQRRAGAGAEPAADALAGVNVGGGGGAALPDGVRDRFEGSLGADLGGVRVHTGGESAAAAESLNAQAFAVGNDIHFAAGRYQPDDPFGMHLLAHEVAHTQQQAGGSPGAQLKDLDVSRPGDASELEADRAADAMVRGEPTTVSGAAPSVQRFGNWLTDDEDEGADASKYAAAPVAKPKPSYLAHAESGRQFPWDLLQPEAKGKKRLNAKIIQDWIDFYGLAVRFMPNLDDPKACDFNLHPSTVNSVVSMFMKDAKAANFIDDPYGAYAIIERDQQAKYKANEQKWKDDQGKSHGDGKAGPQYWPGKEPVPDAGHGAKKGHDTHATLEWEFTPVTTKVGWDGHPEVEGPKHHIKGVLAAKVAEHGPWKAELEGSGVVEFDGTHLHKVGTEIEGKMTFEFWHEVMELEAVAKVLIANDASLRAGKAASGKLSSGILHVEPSAEANIVYTIPGTKKMLEVKGGVSADPEGISLGASFVVKWK